MHVELSRSLRSVRHYYRCCIANCEVKRHVTFAATPIVDVLGVHNHEILHFDSQTVPNTPTKNGDCPGLFGIVALLVRANLKHSSARAELPKRNSMRKKAKRIVDLAFDHDDDTRTLVDNNFAVSMQVKWWYCHTKLHTKRV